MKRGRQDGGDRAHDKRGTGFVTVNNTRWYEKEINGNRWHETGIGWANLYKEDPRDDIHITIPKNRDGNTPHVTFESENGQLDNHVYFTFGDAPELITPEHVTDQQIRDACAFYGKLKNHVIDPTPCLEERQRSREKAAEVERQMQERKVRAREAEIARKETLREQCIGMIPVLADRCNRQVDERHYELIADKIINHTTENKRWFKNETTFKTIQDVEKMSNRVFKKIENDVKRENPLPEIVQEVVVENRAPEKDSVPDLVKPSDSDEERNPKPLSKEAKVEGKTVLEGMKEIFNGDAGVQQTSQKVEQKKIPQEKEKPKVTL